MRMLAAELTGTEAFCYQQEESDNTAQRRVLPKPGGQLPCPTRRAGMTQDHQDPTPATQHSAHLGRHLRKPTRPVTLALAMPLPRMPETLAPAAMGGSCAAERWPRAGNEGQQTARSSSAAHQCLPNARITIELSAARHGCRAAEALYLPDLTHHCSPKPPPRVRWSDLLGPTSRAFIS